MFGETPSEALVAFRFNASARFLQRIGCFEINHGLNGSLQDISPIKKALVTAGLVTGYEYLVNAPGDRAITLYQAGQLKSPSEAFKMNNLGQLWRTLISPVTWEAGVAVLGRNSTFNLVMVAALQNEPDSIKATSMHYGYLAGTSGLSTLASQPFEVIRFSRTDKTIALTERTYPKITQALMAEGITSFWKGLMPRVASVGVGFMVSITVYSEVKKFVTNMDNKSSKA